MERSARSTAPRVLPASSRHLSDLVPVVTVPLERDQLQDPPPVQIASQENSAPVGFPARNVERAALIPALLRLSVPAVLRDLVPPQVILPAPNVLRVDSAVEVKHARIVRRGNSIR